MRYLTSTLILLVLLASSVCADSINVATTFPAFQGENGFWAQAYNPSAASFRYLTNLSSNGNPKFFGTPEQSINMPYLKGVAEGVLYLPARQRPVYGTEWPVLTFVAPTSGYYNMTGSFANGNTSGATTRGIIFVNNSASNPLFSGNVTKTETALFQITILHLDQGDYLRFGVDPLGSDSYDNTILNAVISSSSGTTANTPEPGSLAAMAAGLVGLVAIRRRK